jgi:toxin-antitoxin system PIN domain toxin
MQLPDVNVLIYAHREDAPEHARYAEWLTELAVGREPFAMSELVLAAFLRLVTNPRIFDPATPMDLALAFCARLLERPGAVVVRPTARHWSIFTELVASSKVSGPLVADAYLAALAIEHGCEFVTTDGDFHRFEGLRARHPLA